MRNTLVKWLIDKSAIDPGIFVLTADLGYSVLESYQESSPSTFLNIGVAEQNMTGIACGLASEGFKVYTYSIGIFPTFRCAEQLRNDIDYHRSSVVTCAIGSGVAYGNLGYSHHAIQDIGLMRALPNMVIATPSSPADVHKILDWHYDNPCPLYLRLHKAGEPDISYQETSLNLGSLMKVDSSPALSNSVKARSGACIVVIGFLAAHVKRIVEECSVDIPIFTLPLWGRPALKSVLEQLKNFSTIITVEDHMLEGGFASYLMEGLSMAQSNADVIPVCISADVVGKVAPESTLLNPLLDRLRESIRRVV